MKVLIFITEYKCNTIILSCKTNVLFVCEQLQIGLQRECMLSLYLDGFLRVLLGK
jgi:hypothetical protein